MKNLFFSFLMTLIFSAGTVAFGQEFGPIEDWGKSPNTKIANGVRRSEPVNKLAGIEDLNYIWPGQTVWVPIEVKRGDTFWAIYRDVIYPIYPDYFYLPIQDTTIADQETQQSQPLVQPESEKKGIVDFLKWIPWWVYLLVGLLMLWAIFSDRKEKRNVDPVTAGKPQVPGGVNDSGSYNRMRDLIEGRFPGARLDIKNIRRGRLSGLATVHYAEGKPKKLRLRGTAAYAGEVVVNGQTETIYFLQGCGNDARSGNYMSGNLIFEPDVVVNEDGSESPLPSAPTENKPVVEQSVVPEVIRSEYDGQVGQAMKLAEKVVTENPSHEVSIEIPKNEGSFRMVIKAQYPKLGVKTEKEVKKEN